jgi:hypothetical protein
MGQCTTNRSDFGQALFVSKEPTRLNEALTLANHCCVGSIPTSLGLMLFKPSCHQTCSCAVRVAGPANGSLNKVKWMIVFFITSRILPGMPRMLDWSVNSEPATIPVISSIIGSYVMTSLSDLAAWRASLLYSAGERF